MNETATLHETIGRLEVQAEDLRAQLDAANARLAVYAEAEKSATVEAVQRFVEEYADNQHYAHVNEWSAYDNPAEESIRLIFTALVAQSTHNSVATMEAVVARDEALRERDEAIAKSQRAEAVVAAARNLRGHEPAADEPEFWSDWDTFTKALSTYDKGAVTERT